MSWHVSNVESIGHGPTIFVMIVSGVAMLSLDEYICSQCNSWDDDLVDDICAACESGEEY
jgi:hypothetical protein